MTLSLLIVALMLSTLAALTGVLVADGVRKLRTIRSTREVRQPRPSARGSHARLSAER